VVRHGMMQVLGGIIARTRAASAQDHPECCSPIAQPIR
jgi:hypothetical protein